MDKYPLSPLPRDLVREEFRRQFWLAGIPAFLIMFYLTSKPKKKRSKR